MTPSSPNATLIKFGYPGSLVHEGRHWVLLVRPTQPTLGSLILCATGEEKAYGALPADAFAEQGELIPRIEQMLRKVSQYERINYLMLMMVDPHVHFHILPRYADERVFENDRYPDSGWPGQPDLSTSIPATSALIEHVRRNW